MLAALVGVGWLLSRAEAMAGWLGVGVGACETELLSGAGESYSLRLAYCSCSTFRKAYTHKAG